ncbi:MAG: DNA-directed RNA polymerase subunit K [archaeon]|nr:DNA-directed RNA polymerase subunit K [archaeon]
MIFLEEYTRYEKSRIIGARALQISMGAPPLIKSKDTNPINLAKAEFEKGTIPITVVR